MSSGEISAAVPLLVYPLEIDVTKASAEGVEPLAINSFHSFLSPRLPPTLQKKG